MKVKGSAVLTIPEFVKAKYPARYDDWVAALPEAGKKLFGGKVLVSSWYPLKDALVDPTATLCNLFYAGRPKGAWEAGRFSAEHALKGIYKVFVKVGTPQFIIKRASQIFSSYFTPSEIRVAEAEKHRTVVHITRFPESHTLVEYRIAGWIEKALEISGCRLTQAKIGKSLAKGDPLTELIFEWK